MATYLAVDYGEARVGLAVASGKDKIALPLVVVVNDAQLLPRLAAVVKEHGVTDVVVGWPVSLAGNTNERTRATEAFIARLTRTLGIPVHTSDERFTTELAKRLGGTHSRGRSDDAQAAAAILDSFLLRLP